MTRGVFSSLYRPFVVAMFATKDSHINIATAAAIFVTQRHLGARYHAISPVDEAATNCGFISSLLNYTSLIIRFRKTPRDAARHFTNELCSGVYVVMIARLLATSRDEGR